MSLNEHWSFFWKFTYFIDYRNGKTRFGIKINHMNIGFLVYLFYDKYFNDFYSIPHGKCNCLGRRLNGKFVLGVNYFIFVTFFLFWVLFFAGFFSQCFPYYIYKDHFVFFVYPITYRTLKRAIGIFPYFIIVTTNLKS